MARIVAHLTTAWGEPIDGESVDFYLDDVYQGWAPTDANGSAALGFRGDLPLGVHVLEVRFGGAVDLRPSGTLSRLGVVPPSRTVLTLQPFEPITTGQPTTISAQLLTLPGQPAVNQSVEWYLNGERVGRGWTDATGTASVRIGKNLPAGTYTLEVTFDGAAAFRASGTSAVLVVEPAQLEIHTVPALPGLAFSMDGRVFRSDQFGIARIRVNQGGTYRLEALPIDPEIPGTRVRFRRWESVFKPFQEVEIPRVRQLQVGFDISHQVSVRFVDQEAQPIDPQRISSFTVRSSSGAVHTLQGPGPHWLQGARVVRDRYGLEARELLYSVESVMARGSNLVNQGQQKFTAGPEDVWQIEVLLYSLRLTASDALFGFPIGKGVRLEYPDGHLEYQPFGPGGELSLESLPRGEYRVRVEQAAGISPVVPVALSRDQYLRLRGISLLDLAVGFILSAATASGLLFLGRPHLLPQLKAQVLRLSQEWRSQRKGRLAAQLRPGPRKAYRRLQGISLPHTERRRSHAPNSRSAQASGGQAGTILARWREVTTGADGAAALLLYPWTRPAQLLESLDLASGPQAVREQEAPETRVVASAPGHLSAAKVQPPRIEVAIRGPGDSGSVEPTEVSRLFSNRPAMTARTEIAIARRVASPANVASGLPAQVYQLRDRVQRKLLAEREGQPELQPRPELAQAIEGHFNQLLAEEGLVFTRADRARLLEWVQADILGYGPLEPLLQDEAITEVMVNGPGRVYIERRGLIEESEVAFEDEAHLRRIIDRIVSPLGRRVDESSPMVDARLPNGYRVNATIPPLALDGPTLTIRKFAQTAYTAQDLIANGTLTGQLLAFLKACVEARVNMVISGGTGTGKTTLLNVVSAFVPAQERIITIEDTAELQLKREHIVRLEYRPANVEGQGEVTIRQLVINALRMRPDRIVVGEARGGEALDMLQAMNTGHDGSLTTVHSNSPRDTLRRIETMVLMAGMDLPHRAIREQIASAIELVVHLERMRDGTRKVVHVAEVQGMEGESVVMQDLFMFQQTGLRSGRVLGELRPTGLRPKFADTFAASGVALPEGIFAAVERD
jgi:pilus assembly protein CpaF